MHYLKLRFGTLRKNLCSIYIGSVSLKFEAESRICTLHKHLCQPPTCFLGKFELAVTIP